MIDQGISCLMSDRDWNVPSPYLKQYQDIIQNKPNIQSRESLQKVGNSFLSNQQRLSNQSIDDIDRHLKEFENLAFNEMTATNQPLLGSKFSVVDSVPIRTS